ncbi:ribonuclease E inhibitor RraB [uncultured Pseudosulfitobacter sp.]|uniref:ribonuclease E inhibitor RraB n=1 Tax=uncultured Pseudosulfitobacter sp. TaxID=2854214 RepID=UPI0030DB4A77
MIFDRVASDGMPLVVVARAGTAPAHMRLSAGHVTVVTCRADLANIGARGMPQGTAGLYALEDTLAVAPSFRAAGAVQIASVTGQGQRLMYLVHRDPLDVTPILDATPVQGFSCAAEEVEDRKALVQFLTPSPVDIRLDGDRRVIAVLHENGDDGLIPRKTDFWFYGRRGSLTDLADGLAAHGFSVDQWLSGPVGVVLTRDMPVSFPEFYELTPVILDMAERAGVEYDGWQTMLMSRP